MPVPSRLLISVATSRAAAASGHRDEGRAQARDGAARPGGRAAAVPAAPSSGGGGSSAGAALVLGDRPEALGDTGDEGGDQEDGQRAAGVQSIHSGATMSSADPYASAPIIVQRRSSGPLLRGERGQRAEQHGSEEQRRENPGAETAATANATPR